MDRDYNEIMQDVVKEWEAVDAEYDIPYYAACLGRLGQQPALRDDAPRGS